MAKKDKPEVKSEDEVKGDNLSEKEVVSSENTSPESGTEEGHEDVVIPDAGQESESVLDSDRIYDANKVSESKTTESENFDIGVIVNLKDHNPERPVEVYRGEEYIGEDVFPEPETKPETDNGETSYPVRDVTDADMLVMADTGTGLAKTCLKVMVNRVSSKLVSRVRFEDGTTDTVMGWGEGYILLSNTNPKPRRELSRGELITSY